MLAMYAIVRDGNKSFRAEEGTVLRLDLRADAAPGSELLLDDVQFVGGDRPRVGTPRVDGARVVATVRGHVKGDKLIAFKYKRRKGFEKKRGHRQKYTEVRVLRIEA
jgi:large subunit ribosomal protein L21